MVNHSSTSNADTADTVGTADQSLFLFPDLGDLFRMHPQCNAATAVEYLTHLKFAGRVVWLSHSDPDTPLQEALSATPYEVDQRTPDWAFAQEEYEQLEGFLQQYPQGRERLQHMQRTDYELMQTLSAPLTWADLWSEPLKQALQTYHQTRRETLDEGPGTLWRERRLNVLIELIQEYQEHQNAHGSQTVCIVVPVDDLHELNQRLGLEPPKAWQTFTVGKRSRVRALADRGWRLTDDDDLNALLSALVQEEGDDLTPKAELDTIAAGIYLAVGQLEPARELLERAAHALQERQPRGLAGITLARLGQVRDAIGERELAERTYRAVLALSHAPAVATHTAEQGLKEPFVLEGLEDTKQNPEVGSNL